MGDILQWECQLPGTLHADETRLNLSLEMNFSLETGLTLLRN